MFQVHDWHIEMRQKTKRTHHRVGVVWCSAGPGATASSSGRASVGISAAHAGAWPFMARALMSCERAMSPSSQWRRHAAPTARREAAPMRARRLVGPWACHLHLSRRLSRHNTLYMVHRASMRPQWRRSHVTARGDRIGARCISVAVRASQTSLAPVRITDCIIQLVL